MLEQLKKYIDDTLGIKIYIHSWKEQNKLPNFLIDSYKFFETSFFNNPTLLMISKADIDLTPNNIRKHLELVTKKWNGACIFVANKISSYDRKRLIEHRIPFIIPNNQIYIPDFGFDLREHFQEHRKPKELFSPATQVVIISALLRERIDKVIPAELAHSLGYFAMTMTRVFNELEAAQIGKLTKVGKERCWIFEGTKKDLWKQTNDMLRSPIKSREPIKLWPKSKGLLLPLSGISALSEMTMINPPQVPIYAMGVEEYRQLDIPKGLQLSHIDEADLELEIWNYNPKLFSAEGRVDPFSLYLSLRETSDERIESALEELMEKSKW